MVIAKSDTSSHAFSILFIFAAIAVGVGLVGLNGELFYKWLMFFGKLLGWSGVHFFVVSVLFVGGVSNNGGFLIGLIPFVVLSFLGGSGLYRHDSYFVATQEPAYTVLIFTVLSLCGLWISGRVDFTGERLALIFARTCMILVNMCFWIGTLWGSPIGSVGRVSPGFFSFVWATALFLVGAWGARVGRRFVVNTCAVFGSIHFYTQWFGKLGASPGSLLTAGLLAIGILYGLSRYNRSLEG